jgi:hypothetical protein
MPLSFKDIVEPMTPHSFLREVWGSKPHHFSRGDNRFASLVPWESLNEVLERHRLTYPRIRLAKGGEYLPRHLFLSEGPSHRGMSSNRLNVDLINLAQDIGLFASA